MPRDLLGFLGERKREHQISFAKLDHSVYQSQLPTYLRLTGMKLGLLLNFGKTQLKDGVCPSRKRFITLDLLSKMQVNSRAFL
jgi:hypothetical protein